MNEDDDMPQLSATTLAALREFLEEQKNIIPPETEPVPENWKVSLISKSPGNFTL